MEKVTKKELSDGTIEYRNSKGVLHREDGPAVEETDGYKAWYLDGQWHREDGPAVEWRNGDKEWLLNGQRHREDGPAVEETGGYKAWYLNGKRHREDGPAIEFADGDKEWYLNGIKKTEKEFNKRMNINMGNDTVSNVFDQDFTYESKLFTSINEFKSNLNNSDKKRSKINERFTRAKSYRLTFYCDTSINDPFDFVDWLDDSPYGSHTGFNYTRNTIYKDFNSYDEAFEVITYIIDGLKALDKDGVEFGSEDIVTGFEIKMNP